MLYNIPGRTGCNLLPDTVKKLMDFSNILSIKAASGRIEEVTELRAICGSELSVYSGDDSLLLPMLSVGAVGVVSVASHLVGLQLKEMIHSFQVERFPMLLLFMKNFSLFQSTLYDY